MAYFRDQTLTFPVKLTTYRDAIGNLVNYATGAPQDAEQEWVRQSIDEAYTRLFQEHPWRYYTRPGRITLSAPYSTGSISTSGSTLTLAGGTLPTWAGEGTLQISGHGKLYRLRSRTSNSTALFHPDFTPASNVAAGTTYTLFQTRYALPGHLLKFCGLADESYGLDGNYMPAGELLKLERLDAMSWSGCFRWTIMPSAAEMGTYSLVTYGYPDRAQTIDYVGQFAPRPLKYDGFARYSSGVSGYTISTVTAGDTTCTATGFTPEAGCIGSVLRFALNGATRVPTGTAGINPYNFQKIITNVASSTITFDSAADATTTSTHFAISDPIDMPPWMISAFYRCCEYLYCMRMNRDRLPMAKALYIEELRKALASESMEPPAVLLPDRGLARTPYRAYNWGGNA